MEEPYKYSCHWILYNWLVWMYPVEFARPVKQKVLAQANAYMHTCVSNCFCLGFAMHSYGRAFAWKHLLAFMHTAHYLINMQNKHHSKYSKANTTEPFKWFTYYLSLTLCILKILVFLRITHFHIIFFINISSLLIPNKTNLEKL